MNASADGGYENSAELADETLVLRWDGPLVQGLFTTAMKYRSEAPHSLSRDWCKPHRHHSTSVAEGCP